MPGEQWLESYWGVFLCRQYRKESFVFNFFFQTFLQFKSSSPFRASVCISAFRTACSWSCWQHLQADTSANTWSLFCGNLGREIKRLGKAGMCEWVNENQIGLVQLVIVETCVHLCRRQGTFRALHLLARITCVRWQSRAFSADINQWCLATGWVM